jgi:hypothetical protein
MTLAMATTMAMAMAMAAAMALAMALAMAVAMDLAMALALALALAMALAVALAMALALAMTMAMAMAMAAAMDLALALALAVAVALALAVAVALAMARFALRTEADRSGMLEHLRTLNLEREWTVEIKRKVKKRSLSQNALFHKWVDCIAKEVGYEVWDTDRMKEELKLVCQCPSSTYIGLDGTVRTERSTSKANTADMAEFMTRVERFAASELGIMLPNPEDVQRMW